MALPGPGWYADQDDDLLDRWWDGELWTEHRQPRQAPAEALPAYVPMASFTAVAAAGPITRQEKDRALRKNNAMAYTGLVLSLVALLLNPFGIPSILGIVFASVGLAKSYELEGSGQKTQGRGTAIAGIILGLLGLVWVALVTFR